MYSWGDDTKGWKNPGTYDYGEAKKPYLDDLAKEAADLGPRSYTSKKGPNLEAVDPKGKILSSNSRDIVLFGIDGTGSMQSWPAEIFDRLPLVYQTLVKYRDDVELSFSVIGDAKWDKWPIQIGDLTKGVALETCLKGLHAEGAGGPGNKESYELWGYFVQEHAQIPNAVSPTIILMGDEKFYDTIDAKQVKNVFGDSIQGPLDSMQMWKNLAQRFDIYKLHKEYARNDAEVVAQWKEALGEQKVVPVYDPLRVVDQAIAIVAEKWGYSEDFKQNMSARQDSDVVDAVYASLRAVSIPALGTGKSIKKSKLLMGGKE